MFYVQRDALGALIRVEAAAFTESTETLPADHHEIQAWYANEVWKPAWPNSSRATWR